MSIVEWHDNNPPEVGGLLDIATRSNELSQAANTSLARAQNKLISLKSAITSLDEKGISKDNAVYREAIKAKDAVEQSIAMLENVLKELNSMNASNSQLSQLASMIFKAKD